MDCGVAGIDDGAQPAVAVGHPSARLSVTVLPAISASQRRLGIGRRLDAGEAHLAAVRGHESAAVDHRGDGDIADCLASAGRAAAMLQRRCASATRVPASKWRRPHSRQIW